MAIRYDQESLWELLRYAVFESATDPQYLFAVMKNAALSGLRRNDPRRWLPLP